MKQSENPKFLGKTAKLGWHEVREGVLLDSFVGDAAGITFLKQEERHYAQTNSQTASVSDWRVIKPVFNRDTCIDCQFCWVFCPDTSIIARDKKMVGVDFDHCKGCGICVEVCPTNPKSLLMFDEHKAIEDALAQWPAKSNNVKESTGGDE